jgi:hypothetical protein
VIPFGYLSKEIVWSFDKFSIPKRIDGLRPLTLKAFFPHERLAVLPRPLPAVRQSERGAGAA